MSKQREENIKSSFDVPVNFLFLPNISEFETLIENFQRKKYKIEEDNVVGENNIFDRLIVMDNVSGLANKSKEFDEFFDCCSKI